jgi:hypothetical protein
MRDHDDLTDRLAQLGSAPVPGDVRDGHVHAMRAATPAPDSPRRFGKLAVAAAALVGFAAGSTGFAMAGALPDPAQGVAHDVLAVVQIEVPDAPPANRGQCISAVARNKDLTSEEKVARKAECKNTVPPGLADDRPGRSGEAPGRSGDHPNEDEDPCTGKPPWAGPMEPTERQRLKDEFAACRGADDDPEADAAEAAEAEEEAREREAAEDAAEAEAEAQEEAEERQAESQEQPAPPAPADPGPAELPGPAQDAAPEDVPPTDEAEAAPEDPSAG